MGSETSSVPNYLDPGHFFHKLSGIAQRRVFDGNDALQARKFTENKYADLLIQRSGGGEYRQEKYDKSSKKTKKFELSQEFIDENRDFAIINYVR